MINLWKSGFIQWAIRQKTPQPLTEAENQHNNRNLRFWRLSTDYGRFLKNEEEEDAEDEGGETNMNVHESKFDEHAPLNQVYKIQELRCDRSISRNCAEVTIWQIRASPAILLERPAAAVFSSASPNEPSYWPSPVRETANGSLFMSCHLIVVKFCGNSAGMRDSR